LRESIAKYGQTNWIAVAAQIPNRTPRQCRERWLTYLDPSVNNGPWTVDEDGLLARKVAELGHRWREIEQFFPGRKDVSIKNHWRQLKQTGTIPQPPHDEKARREAEFDRLFAAVIAEAEEEP
jgi:hypothetical protein